MTFSKEQWRMVMALLMVAVLSTIFLGVTNMLTRAPIAEAERQALMDALMQVLPKHDNDPIQDTRQITLPKHKQATTFYLSRNQDRSINAIAWETIAPDGYNGSIRILMAVRPDGSLNAVRITYHQETPGLGDGIMNLHWLDAFVGKSLTNAHWTVKKDGGDFDQFTGATITPRAVVKAIKKGLEMFAREHSHLLENKKQKVKESNDALR
ncbi:MAG: RnfABCDGE type electron transport complex subunit G [Zetaproteobacteria bacterium]|nr:RnfABCDGE type electron transport complex subunit G [Zetaproteobacteria bacterium]